MTITWGFGPAMEDSFSSLCQQIRVTFEAHAKDAFNHNLQTQSLGKLQGFLNFHKNNLLSPLSYPGRKEEDRQNLASYRIFMNQAQLPDQFKDIALKLSDELNLNELFAMNLVYAVAQPLNTLTKSFNQEAVILSCKELYYQERYDWCSALLTLLQGRVDDNINALFSKFLIKYTDELI
jgi:hypothetical protein